MCNAETKMLNTADINYAPLLIYYEIQSGTNEGVSILFQSQNYWNIREEKEMEIFDVHDIERTHFTLAKIRKHKALIGYLKPVRIIWALLCSKDFDKSLILIPANVVPVGS